MRRLSATPAAPGYAAGPLVRLAGAGQGHQQADDPAVELARLLDAIETAGAELADLTSALTGTAAEVLEFQGMMLEDSELYRPALDAVTGGAAADAAWRAVLDAEIAGYAASNDETFRARSADLADIRDRVLRVLGGGETQSIPSGAIVHTGDLAPSQFLTIDWSAGGGILLETGSPASHVAMLARARAVPMLVGSGAIDGEDGTIVLLDAVAGTATLDPDAESASAFAAAATLHAEQRLAAEARLGGAVTTADGVRVELMLNIADPAEVDVLDPAHCDGVGLMRTEFLFARGLPDEEAQVAAYRRVLEWAGGRPVTIRTVDAGGDKPVPGFTLDESNPFLGTRGIRLSLARPDIFRVQIRALLRAADAGTLKIMFPMVALASEFEAARALFAEEAAALGLSVPPLGIMVEVPAAAIAPDAFADPAFFSIGSNDLTQYVMAAARDTGAVAALNDSTHPAVLGLIRLVADYGAEHGIPVSLCGDAGGDPRQVPLLLRAGVRQFSVAPALLAGTRDAIAASRADG